MSTQTLAILFFAALAVNLGVAIATPRDTRPWTSARTTAAIVGCVQLTFAIWLAIEVLA